MLFSKEFKKSVPVKLGVRLQEVVQRSSHATTTQHFAQGMKQQYRQC